MWQQSSKFVAARNSFCASSLYHPPVTLGGAGHGHSRAESYNTAGLKNIYHAHFSANCLLWISWHNWILCEWAPVCRHTGSWEAETSGDILHVMLRTWDTGICAEDLPTFIWILKCSFANYFPLNLGNIQLNKEAWGFKSCAIPAGVPDVPSAHGWLIPGVICLWILPGCASYLLSTIYTRGTPAWHTLTWRY